MNGALLLAGLLLVAFGAESLYHAAVNRRPFAVSCESFAQSPPRALWLRVTGCEVDYIGAGYRESRGRIVELYFPARPAGWADTEPAPLVAATRDPAVLALADATIGGGRTPDQEQFLVMMLKIVTALRAARVIEGYANANLLSRLSARRAVAGLNTPVAPGVVVVDLHARPRLLVPAAATAAGVLLLGAFVILRSRRRTGGLRMIPAESTATARAHDAAAEDPAHPPAPPAEAAAMEAGEAVEGTPGGVPARAAPPQLSPTRLHIMLLNLPRDADRRAIESAPPLGSHADVIAALTQVIPDLRFDRAGKASVDRSDLLLAIDVGPMTPVYTVVVEARGVAALPTVRRIVDATGWRAFAPKAGVFVDVDRLNQPPISAAGHTAA